jgi:hypothetical protein
MPFAALAAWANEVGKSTSAEKMMINPAPMRQMAFILQLLLLWENSCCVGG